MIGLCDCNNFFVSCERVFNPSLNGQPVVVLSNNDGCVISRSNEAKAIGIKMGQPLYQIKELIEEGKVRVFSSNYQLYGDMSSRVMATIKGLVSGLEVYSVDEAFFYFNHAQSLRYAEVGRDLLRTVRRNTGIPVSIGLAPTKTLAKIAAERCKKDPSLQGVCLLDDAADIESLLFSYPIEEVWGIGRRYSKMLTQNGVFTAGQFVKMSTGWVRSQMGVMGLRTRAELKGIPCLELEHQEQTRQQICNSRSFAFDLDQYDELHRAVVMFATQSADKLREQQCVCSQVLTFVYTNYYRENIPQYRNSRLIQLDVPTESTAEIVQAAVKAFRSVYLPHYKYKKVGVILSQISSNQAIQTSLFDETDRVIDKKLMTVLDGLNRRHGKASVVLASHGITPLQVNRNYVSNRYTTDWNEILTVKV